MSNPPETTEAPHWTPGPAESSSAPVPATPAPAAKPAPVKRDESAAGEEDPDAALDSLDTEATGQPDTAKPAKPSPS